jgi:hypothetical protein
MDEPKWMHDMDIFLGLAIDPDTGVLHTPEFVGVETARNLFAYARELRAELGYESCGSLVCKHRCGKIARLIARDTIRK